ncbi:MAG: hypothetical protein R2878_11780 [Thermoleophilia bacterium]
MDSVQGLPSWYELTTPPGGLDRAIAFYGVVFGWDVVDSGMEGFDYRLARAGGDMVAGLLAAQPRLPRHRRRGSSTSVSTPLTRSSPTRWRTAPRSTNRRPKFPAPGGTQSSAIPRGRCSESCSPT